MTREEAIEIIENNSYVFYPLDFDRTTMINTALDMAIEALKQEPSEITPQEKIGAWIFKNDNITILTGYYQCSKCKKGKILNKDNFCPNCGAKMIEREVEK